MEDLTIQDSTMEDLTIYVTTLEDRNILINLTGRHTDGFSIILAKTAFLG